jgi:hypothetical protein
VSVRKTVTRVDIHFAIALTQEPLCVSSVCRKKGHNLSNENLSGWFLLQNQLIVSARNNNCDSASTVLVTREGSEFLLSFDNFFRLLYSLIKSEM